MLDKKLTDNNKMINALEWCEKAANAMGGVTMNKEQISDIIAYIKRLELKNDRLTVENLELIAGIKNIKLNACKEFAERLKKEHFLADEHDIDNLLKEMKGE